MCQNLLDAGTKISARARKYRRTDAQWSALSTPLASTFSASALEPFHVYARTSEIIGRQVEYMTSLIHDLLDVSRVATGVATLDNQLLDVRQIVTEPTEQVLPLIEERNHRFTLEAASTSMLINGDRKRLVQFVTNLLQNTLLLGKYCYFYNAIQWGSYHQH